MPGVVALKALITGATGFVGSYLADYLKRNTAMAVYGTDARAASTLPPHIVERFDGLYQMDVRDPIATHELFDMVRPDYIFHLAAQAHVPTSLHAPWETLETNIHGTLNVLESLRNHKKARVLMIGSADVYGVFAPEDLPLDENQPFNPANPYSVSKAAQELLSRQYHLTYHLDVIMTRPFNHIGPGQNKEFALPNFADQIVQMERGSMPPVLHVGNLSAARDFTDVRDVVRAYTLLIEKGEAGQVYNVCRGQAYELRELVEQLIRLAQVEVEIQIDSERLRPVEVPVIIGDASRLKSRTGWEAEIPIEKTLQDILTHFREG